MDITTLDALRLNYKQATEEWVAAIRAEEALSGGKPTEVGWEHWDAAGIAEEEAAEKAKAAKEKYKDGLREINLGF